MAWNPMAVRWGRLYEGTKAERALEDAVAALGVPYRTQFPGWKYGCRFFPDFFLPTLRLVIEVDDASHNKREKIEADEIRSEVIMETWGARVVRITNEKALTDPVGSVRAALQSVRLWPLPSNLPTLAESLPALRKAPKRERREAKSKARRAARARPRRSASRPRNGGRGRSRQPPPQVAERHLAPRTRPAEVQALPPAQPASHAFTSKD